MSRSRQNESKPEWQESSELTYAPFPPVWRCTPCHVRTSRIIDLQWQLQQSLDFLLAKEDTGKVLQESAEALRRRLDEITSCEYRATRAPILL